MFEKEENKKTMSVSEALATVQAFNKKSNPSREDEFLFIEALEYLIATENKPEYMMELGGYYYEQRRFDLALKYYEMASVFGIDAADECLGYIWYYGRTGERNYEKAFWHYSRSMERGNLTCAYKVADMYKNGYYVEKDYNKYVSMIEDLYPRVKNCVYLHDPVPEVFTRLAKIRSRQGRKEEAIQLYWKAKNFLAQRLSYNAFFGNLNVMKWMIDDLYQLIPFDVDNFDFYDLYYLLKNPVQIRFTYDGKVQNLEALLEDGTCVVHFNDKWYRDRDEFFAKACVAGERLTAVYNQLEDFEVL